MDDLYYSQSLTNRYIFSRDTENSINLANHETIILRMDMKWGRGICSSLLQNHLR